MWSFRFGANLVTAQMAFDLGERKRRGGLETALSHYGIKIIASTISQVANTKRTFTSEDVLAALFQGTRDQLATRPNALGAIMRLAAVRGVIEPTGQYVCATHPAARKRKIGVWRLKQKTS